MIIYSIFQPSVGNVEHKGLSQQLLLTHLDILLVLLVELGSSIKKHLLYTDSFARSLDGWLLLLHLIKQMVKIIILQSVI